MTYFALPIFAAAEACRERRIAARTFEKQTAALVDAGAIPLRDEPLWTDVRKLRNRATHPASHSVYGFSTAFDILRVVCDLINRIEWLQA